MLAKKKFDDLKRRANDRNLVWNLTFDEWYNWWLSNGIDKNQKSQYSKSSLVMCRHNDTGPYELKNIYCATMEQNCKDSFKFGFNPWQKRTGTTGNARPVQTPMGQFVSVNEAIKAYNSNKTTFYRWLKNRKSSFFYL